MHLMLLSSSRTAGTPFLAHARPALDEFLASAPDGPLAFAPFAGIAEGYEAYTARVAELMSELGRETFSLAESPKRLDEAAAVIVGGGNTFHLLREMQTRGLLERVRERVLDGMPYVGWSAGSNLACPSIRTTNDMPIVEPESFQALNLIPFQINPHYIEGNPPGHQGETRAQRLNEFLKANPGVGVLGLPEGCRVVVSGERTELQGERLAWWFEKADHAPEPVTVGASLESAA